MFWYVFAACMIASLCQCAYADSYEIVFEEGFYKYDHSRGPEASHNKYLARVTIKKDGVLLAKDIRGSTLPDAWVFYRSWNVEKRRTDTPRDLDIVAMFDQFEAQKKSLAEGGAMLGRTRLADIADILEFVNRVPVIKQGRYPFVMGVHKLGNSPYGKPYVPRLLGGSEGHPYDPADHKTRADDLGGFIVTLNKNKAQQQRRVANGINIHNGRPSKELKDSEGCLTINPGDWASFYSVLPSPDGWRAAGHTGTVSVKR